jgi:hypothetical protein
MMMSFDPDRREARLDLRGVGGLSKGHRGRKQKSNYANVREQTSQDTWHGEPPDFFRRHTQAYAV